jgi:type II secretory ATPase GspE/PulE/Tfp pilus assembly ATPase PilB-like protein
VSFATAPTADGVVLSGLARAMVQHQLLDLDQAVAVQNKADAADAKFIDEVVSGGTMPAARLARFAADTFGLPLVDLAALDADMLPTDLIDTKLLTETLILPIAKHGNRLIVLLSDPTDLPAIDRVKFRAQATVDPIVVEHDKLLKLVERLSRSLTDQTDAAVDDDSSDFQSEETDRAGKTGAAAGNTVLSGLARAMVQHQLLGLDQAVAVQNKADAADAKFIDEVVSGGTMPAARLARFAADTFGLPLVDLAALDADMLPTDLIDTKLLTETLILPIAKHGNRLIVLLSDPTDLPAIDRVKFRAQATVDPIVVEHDKLLKLVERLSRSLTDQTDAAVDDDSSDFQSEETDRAGKTGAAAGNTVLSGLARAMVQHQLIRPEQATAIQRKADDAQRKFIDELVSSGQLRALTLARFASDTFGLPLMDLGALDADMLLTDLIDPKLLAETLILPIAKRGNRLTVLLSDPTDLQAIDRVKFRAQATVDPIVVEHDKLLKFVERLSQSLTDQMDAVDDDDSSNFQPEETDEGLALRGAVRLSKTRRGTPNSDRAGTTGTAGTAADNTVLSGLARAMAQHQLIRPEQATAIQRKADAAQRKFIDELVSSGQLRALTLARFASDTFGLPLMDLAALDADMLLTDLIDPKLLAETLILPIAKRGNRLIVLLSDPTDLQAIDRVKFRAQATVDPIVVEHDKLLKFVEQLSQSLTDQLEPVEEDYFKDLPMGLEEGDIRVFDENTPLRSATPK